MADIRHTGALCLLLDDFTRSALGANEQNLVLVASQASHHIQRFIEGGNCVLQVDDVNLIAGTKNVLIHFRIPVTGLVAKVSACL